jgi:hypothetical protein
MQAKIEKRTLADAFCICGVVISAIDLLAFFIPYLEKELIQKGRLGSFFQYPNTFALFILICIILIINREKIQIYHLIGMTIMWTSLLLSFSRSMYIIGLGAVVFISIYDRKKLKYILTTLLLGIGLWYIIMLLGEFSHMFNRIEQTSGETSELLTRLLYYKDSLSIMRD